MLGSSAAVVSNVASQQKSYVFEPACQLKHFCMKFACFLSVYGFVLDALVSPTDQRPVEKANWPL